MLPRYGYTHEDRTAMRLRFRCASSPRRWRYVNFEQVKTIDVRWRSWWFRYPILRPRCFYYASTALLPFLLRFLFFLTKISNRSRTIVPWNGVLRIARQWERYISKDRSYRSPINIFKHGFHKNHWANWTQISYGCPLGWEYKSLYMTKIAATPIYGKTLKIVSRIRTLVTLTLGM